MRYITALLALVGFLLLLGAAGDSDRGAGTHIQERRPPASFCWLPEPLDIRKAPFLPSRPKQEERAPHIHNRNRLPCSL